MLLGRAIELVPKSDVLWSKAIEAESEKNKKKLLKKALTIIPESSLLWKIAVELEKEDESRKKLLYKAVECCPEDKELWLTLARLCDYEEARKVLNRGLKHMPTEIKLYVSAAKLEETAESGKNKVIAIVERSFKSLEKQNVNISLEEWLKETEIALEAGLTGTAEAIVKNIVGRELIDADETRETHLRYASQGNNAMARLILEQFVRVNDEPELWVELIRFVEKSGEPGELEGVLKLAVEHNKDTGYFWIVYAKTIWHLDRDCDRTLQIIRQAKQFCEEEEIFTAEIKILALGSKYEEALKVAEEHSSKGPEFEMRAVQVLREMNKPQEAAKRVLKAINNNPSFFKFYLILHQIRLETGEFEEAEKALKDGQISKNVLIVCALSQFYRNRKQFGKARSLLEQNFAYFQSKPEIWKEAVAVETQSGNMGSASSVLSRGLKIASSDLLWDVAVELEPTQTKLSKANEALKLFEHSGRINTRIGLLYKQADQAETAKKWFKKAAQTDAKFGDSFVHWYFTEGEEGKKHVLDLIDRLKPKYGDIWQKEAKKVENWKLKHSEILSKIAYK